MSAYEILVFVALAGASAFAYRLYRKDTRSPGLGTPAMKHEPGELMFGRQREAKIDDSQP